jgi:glyoxylase-like metal-dependent hydrolase (beta-lactamase superfamily II)
VPNGVLVKVSPLVRRLVAPNPSAFTSTGTCSYIIGEGDVAILDPGPDDEAHFARLLEAVAGERVAYLVVTHTHRDHSPLAARLRSATGAPVVGAARHVAREGAPQGLDASHDMAYAPDAVLVDGERIRFGGVELETLATPGHAANHLCFAMARENALFSGDHVMAWSTSVVAPPDGSMGEYMNSLEKLRPRGEDIYWPGHGGPVRDPRRYVRALLTHRRQREASILTRLEAGEATIPEIVARVYQGLDPRLVGAASLSTLAHLDELIARGLVARADGPPLKTSYSRL